MNAPSTETTVAESLAGRVLALRAETIPAPVRQRAEELLIDVIGLCAAARRTDYMRAMIAAVDAGGPCTAVGHAGGFSAEAAALINGTATHGEDFDDTFEGGPIHSSCVIVPAVLAACERFRRDGRAALAGIACGIEATCRLSMVVPKAVHRSGFHPTSGAPLGFPPDERSGNDRRGARGVESDGLEPPADCRCARPRGQHGERHH